MPLNVTMFRIFIGAAEDAWPEVAQVTAALDGLNIENDVFKYDAVNWKDSTYSSLGSGEPQAEINDQIFNSCDACIFLVHASGGRPRSDGRSGLQMEIEKALEFKRMRGAMVSAYFLQSDIPNNIEVDLLITRNKIKSICENAGLYKPYVDKGDLQQQVRLSAIGMAKSTKSESNRADVIDHSDVKARTEQDSNSDLGILELIEESEYRLGKAVNYLNSFNSEQSVMASGIGSFVDGMKYANFSSISSRERIQYFDKAAQHVRKFIDECQPGLFEFENNAVGAIGAVHSIVQDWPSGVTIDDESLINLIEGMRAFEDIYQEVFSTMSELKRSADSVPRFTKSIKVEWRRLDSFLDDFIGAINKMKKSTDDLLSLWSSRSAS